MPRGYRCIVLALVGWLALTGANRADRPPEKAGPASNAQSEKPPANPLPVRIIGDDYAPYPNYKDERCYKEANHDRADLCAQWRAARAAEDAADATRFANFIAVGGALLSFISVVLVVIALSQTRKANRIAHSSARPHIIVSLENFSRYVSRNEAQVKFDISATNVGGTGCVVSGVFHTWGKEDDTPEIAIGMRFVAPVAAGATRSIDPIQVSRKKLVETPIIRGFVTIEGPFISEEEKLIRFAFNVLPELAHPHLVHYNVFAENHWADLDRRRHKAKRRDRYQFWKRKN